MSSTKARDSSNSSSLSCGKPTITSVVSAGFPYTLRSRSHLCLYSSAVYFRFIRFSVPLLPLCSERWKCGHTFGIAAIASANSSVMDARLQGSETDSSDAVHCDQQRGSGRAASLFRPPGNRVHRRKGGYRSARLPGIRPPPDVFTSSTTSLWRRLLTLPRAYGIIQ